MRRLSVLLFISILLFTCSQSPQQKSRVSFDFTADVRLFTVFAFMNAAGYNHDWQSMHPMRVEIREAIKQL
ncbi:hypothetical protein JW960_00645 [candidate division KSB1 bacterium]|nr:hypothetical protein [candidate division KSB1 bacterium]